MSLETKDESKRVKLIDPHTGIAGALVPLPPLMRGIAMGLAGRTMKLGTALKRMKVGVPEGFILKASEGSILLQSGTWNDVRAGKAIHCWRVLRFESASN